MVMRRTPPPIYPSRPGGSARDHYRRLRAAGAARRRITLAAVSGGAALVLLVLLGPRAALAGGLLAAAAALVWQWRRDDHRTWLQGARGEERTARRLQRLEMDGYVVLHDRQIPGSRANLDHLVICPSGLVVVVDSKQWGRNRFVKGDGRSLRVGRVGGKKVVAAAAFERRRVAELLARDLGPADAPPVAAVLAIHGGRLPAWRTPVVDGIPLVPARRIRSWIKELDDGRPDIGLLGLVGEASHRVFPPYVEPSGPAPAAAPRYDRRTPRGRTA